MGRLFLTRYHPYGTTAYQAKNGDINAVAKRYRYTGKERDEESGLYYHGARYYVPWLCRWVSVDPLESKYAGMSPYNYGFNNPVVWNDLSGADPTDPPKPGGSENSGEGEKNGDKKKEEEQKKEQETNHPDNKPSIILSYPPVQPFPTGVDKTMVKNYYPPVVITAAPTVMEAAEMAKDVYDPYDKGAEISGGWIRLKEFHDIKFEDKETDFQSALYFRKMLWEIQLMFLRQQEHLA